MLLFWLIGLNALRGQKTEPGQTLLVDSLIIMASRLETKAIGLPFSTLSLDLKESLTKSDLFSVNDLIQTIPGIYASNSLNQTQDTRISIRGFGSRSAFGIRGIKILVDGVPETTPDGQGQLDNLVLNSLTRVEIVRTAQSALYGNASGGLIAFYTHRDFESPYLDLSSRFGENGYLNLSGTAGLIMGRTKLIGSFSSLSSTGFREWSDYKNQSFSLQAKTQLKQNESLDWNISYTDSPTAQDPGGLNLIESTLDRRAASSRNKEFMAGEEIRHFKSSAQYRLKINQSTNLQSLAYYSIRDFTGLLPFENSGYIELFRKYGGGNLSLTNTQSTSYGFSKTQMGLDLASQSDHRERYDNKKGTISVKRLDQVEGFDNFGFYVTNQLNFKKLTLHSGLRFDINSLALDDLFEDNRDDSGKRNLNSLNYSFGLNFKINDPLYVFTNISSSFETPALSELSSALDGGFDPLLKAQDAINFEFGIQNRSDKNPHFSLSTYYIKTKNEIIAYELAGQSNRVAFRNAGETERKGIEANIQYVPSNRLKLTSGFDLNDIRFLEYELNGQNLNGNKLPGIPNLSYFFGFDFNSKYLWLKIDSRLIGRIFADELNLTEVPAITVVNMRIGSTFKSLGGRIQPFVGVNNLFSEKYFDNIRINAFGGRYYEPGTGIYVFGGLKLNWNN